MVYVNLQQRAFKKIDLCIDIQADTQLEVETSFSFNVNYKEDHTACSATLIQHAILKNNPDKFRITVEVTGNFICEGINTDDDKKQAHINCYTLLFPYAQEMIADLSVKSGLAPLMIDMMRMSPEDVKMGSN